MKTYKTVKLFTSASRSSRRFAVSNQRQLPIFYGIFVDADGYKNTQLSADILAAKKAIFLAKKIESSSNTPISLQVFVKNDLVKDHEEVKKYINYMGGMVEIITDSFEDSCALCNSYKYRRWNDVTLDELVGNEG